MAHRADETGAGHNGEPLKAENALEWVGIMNNIRVCDGDCERGNYLRIGRQSGRGQSSVTFFSRGYDNKTTAESNMFVNIQSNGLTKGIVAIIIINEQIFIQKGGHGNAEIAREMSRNSGRSPF